MTDIGIVLPKYAALAPMASVADFAYRQICREHGASLTVSEMVSAKGLVYGDKKTARMCIVDKTDTHYSLQFFTSEPDVISKAIEMLPDVCGGRLPDFIDINMGCPVPKVVGNGCGAALMKDIKLASDIMTEAVKAAEKLRIPGGIPLSAKIRSGYDEENINAVEFAKALEDAGAAFITVHPRTKKQLYGGHSDPDIIKQVKEALKIPVIGNGDIKTPEDAAAMYNETGCDLVMVGRGSYGKPWIFSQIREFSDTGKYSPEPPHPKRAEIMLRQIELAVIDKGERAALSEARSKCAFYVRGTKNAAALRRKCGEIKSFEDVKAIADAMCE
ncbi:MAG: tRNA dihydrouridine synthase DusB [Ruminococcus sp.]|jgi:tRNA-dihydrouridine synthase B|nr:tRNA dihydrouridine synthase DusB [Ruminococcus sp.]